MLIAIRVITVRVIAVVAIATVCDCHCYSCKFWAKDVNVFSSFTDPWHHLRTINPLKDSQKVPSSSIGCHRTGSTF